LRRPGCLVGIGHFRAAHIGHIVKNLGHEFQDMAVAVDNRVAQFGVHLRAGGVCGCRHDFGYLCYFAAPPADFEILRFCR
jgi:hypothetical protein